MQLLIRKPIRCLLMAWYWYLLKNLQEWCWQISISILDSYYKGSYACQTPLTQYEHATCYTITRYCFRRFSKSMRYLVLKMLLFYYQYVITYQIWGDNYAQIFSIHRNTYICNYFLIAWKICVPVYICMYIRMRLCVYGFEYQQFIHIWRVYMTCLHYLIKYTLLLVKLSHA